MDENQVITIKPFDRNSFYLADFRKIYKDNLFGFEVVRPRLSRVGWPRLIGLELVARGHLHRCTTREARQIPMVEIKDNLFSRI
jgi:hypothetical protein